MAVAAYTTDLTDIYTDTDNFSTVGGGRVTAAETDDYIQGANCWSHDPFSTGTEGGMYNGTHTITADDAVLLWLKCDVVATLATKANGGMQALIGSAIGDYKGWYVRGSDDYAAGGWINVAIDPLVTASTTVGAPTTTTSWFGCVWYVPSTGASKGYPMKIDAMRHGRCELLINGGEAGSLATFAGMAAVNDTTANKWGLFEAQEGGAAGYKWKGLMSFGPTSLTTFTDSDIVISIENTEYVSAAFNRIEFNNASSVINWTNVNITAIGTVSKGQFEMIDNCTFNDTGGIFTDMDSFVYQSNATLTGRTFRRCGLVTQGGATFTECTFEEPSGTVGLLVDDLDLVTGCTFSSDGTGHAVNLGTISADTEYDWENSDTGYTDASSGNETILVSVASTFTLTINVLAGNSTPTYYNTGAGDVTLVISPVTTLITVRDIDTGTVIVGARVYLATDGHIPSGGTPTSILYEMDTFNTGDAGVEIFNEVTDDNGQVSDTRSLLADADVEGRVRRATSGTFYKTVPISETIDSDNGLTLNVYMIKDE